MKKNRNMTGVSVGILESIREEEHCHPEIELLYILDGCCDVYLGSELYQLKKEDVLLINSNKKHRLEMKDGSFTGQILLSYYEICAQTGEDHLLFWCNTVTDYDKQYDELKKLLRELLMESIHCDGKDSYRQYGMQFCLLDFLLKHFKVKTSANVKENGWGESRRLSVITNYVHMNYMNQLSLSEVAQKLYLSASSLSRFFIRETGESFVEYVKKVRLQKVAEDLLYSEMPITRIAVDNGFSNPSVMNKAFREVYGMTPTMYKAKMLAGKAKKSPEPTLEKKEAIQALLSRKDTASRTFMDSRQQIDADLSSVQGYLNMENKIINIGAAYSLHAADMQRQVLYIQEQLGFEYVRIWNIFSEQFMISEQKERKKLNFNKLDTIFDFCVEHNIKLFLDMGFRPDTAMISSRSSLYVYDEGMEFNSQAEWEWILERFVMHLIRRYGYRVVQSWVFEFTFFFLQGRPYYKTERYSSTRVWESSYQIVKKLIPDGLVAGPGLTPMPDEEMLGQTIAAFLNTKYVPDIFTMIVFPYMDYQDEDEVYRKRMTDTDFIQHQADSVKRALDRFGFQGQFYITEWSNSIANRNYIQDSCYRGSYILKNVLHPQNTADAMGFWYASDLINMYYDSRNILNGSSGLLTKDGICKPSFYAFLFLNSMERQCIQQGTHYVITANDRQNIYILCFHHIEFGPNYYLKEENTYEARELSDLYQSNEPLRLEFRLTGFEGRKQYLVRQKIVNEREGSVLDKWIELGCEQEIGPDDIQYLKQTAVPKVTMERRTITNNLLNLSVELMPHEMRWIHIQEDLADEI